MIEGLQGFLEGVHPLLYIGTFILAGYAGGRAAHALNLPRISGYIVAGMFLSPSVSGLLSRGVLENDLSMVTDIALGVIAFSIGGSLEAEKLRRLGRPIIVITFVQAVVVSILVAGAVVWLYPRLPGARFIGRESLLAVALLLGAICAATAPSAVLGVVHEYRARGPLTTVLLGIVTLDDGITLILFSVAAGLAQRSGGKGTSLVSSGLLDPGREVLIALLIGGAVGIMARLLIPVVRRKGALLGLSLGAVFVTSGLALSIGSSALLACMMLGFVMVNTMNHPEQWFDAIDRVEEPVFAMFFVLAGAHLRFDSLIGAGTLTLLIILMRTAGKLGGAYLGGLMSSGDRRLRRYLPFGLLPQAGVAIGLVLAAKDFVSDAEAAGIMVNAVLASVIVNELFSPPLVRMALVKAGETEGNGGE